MSLHHPMSCPLTDENPTNTAGLRATWQYFLFLILGFLKLLSCQTLSQIIPNIRKIKIEQEFFPPFWKSLMHDATSHWQWSLNRLLGQSPFVLVCSRPKPLVPSAPRLCVNAFKNQNVLCSLNCFLYYIVTPWIKSKGPFLDKNILYKLTELG